MSQINWGLAQGGGFQNALAQGLQIGGMIRQRREEKEYKNALAQYDPSNPETIKPVMQADPRMGMQLQQQAAQQQQQAEQQRQQQMGTMRKLLQHAKTNPMQALQAAQQMGIDTSRIPPIDSPEFQPWVDQQLFIADALETPEGKEALSTAGKVAVDMGFQPGTPEFQQKVTEVWQQQGAIPYTDSNGATRLYIPGRTGNSGPEPGSVVGGFRFKGGNPNDPNAWEQAGGPTQPASGNFR